MNILVEELPEAVEIEGKEYPLDTDYRTALRVILAFEDPELALVEKRAILLTHLYPDMPGDRSEAFRLGLMFLNGGSVGEEEEVSEEGPRLYSFGKDAGLIFAAFRQTHGIDLETTRLHWWKFLALFMDLGADTAFCNLVSLRKRVKSGKATKDELAAAREMGEAFEIPEPDRRTAEERKREDEFIRLVKLAEAGRKGDHANL